MNLYLQFVLRYLNPISTRNSFSSSASFLAITGLAIGVFALILTMSVIKGFELTLEKKISNIDGLFRIQHIFGELVNERDNLDSILISKNINIDINPDVLGSNQDYNGTIDGISSIDLGLNIGGSFFLTENIDCSLMLYMGITELMNEDVYYKSVESTSLSIGYTF